MAALADAAPGAARTVRDDRVWVLLPAKVDAVALASALHERLGVAAGAAGPERPSATATFSPDAASSNATTAPGAAPANATTSPGAAPAGDAAALRFALAVAGLAASLVADGIVSPAGAARGTWRLLLRDAVRAPDDVRALAAALGPLLADRTTQAGEQRRTLAAYLANDCNMNATAAAMPAHRHTVAYRLDRIRELTGLDPLRAEDREQLGVALKARAVAKVTQASRG
jgi:hypothetical protein